MSNIEPVISALQELSGWLASSEMQKRVEQIIEELNRPDLSAFQRRQIKRELSKDILFHPKCLGDFYIEDFKGDAWRDYLCGIEAICQRNL